MEMGSKCYRSGLYPLKIWSLNIYWHATAHNLSNAHVFSTSDHLPAPWSVNLSAELWTCPYGPVKLDPSASRNTHRQASRAAVAGARGKVVLKRRFMLLPRAKKVREMRRQEDRSELPVIHLALRPRREHLGLSLCNLANPICFCFSAPVCTVVRMRLDTINSLQPVLAEGWPCPGPSARTKI